MNSLTELAQQFSTILVDVSPEEDFRRLNLPGSVNIPLDQIPLRSYEVAQWGGVPVIIFCRNGYRSGQAVDYLRHYGLHNVHHGGSMEKMLTLFG